jgi:hypothetical protein
MPGRDCSPCRPPPQAHRPATVRYAPGRPAPALRAPHPACGGRGARACGPRPGGRHPKAVRAAAALVFLAARPIGTGPRPRPAAPPLGPAAARPGSGRGAAPVRLPARPAAAGSPAGPALRANRLAPNPAGPGPRVAGACGRRRVRRQTPAAHRLPKRRQPRVATTSAWTAPDNPGRRLPTR